MRINLSTPFYLTLSVLLILSSSGISDVNEYEDPSEGCTVGVASGRATPDGRPLLWKTRDASAPDNEVYYRTTYPINYICVISAGQTSYSWMGVNERGFSIINSASTDLPAGTTGMGNGSIMAYALGHCRTVAEFQHLLDSTNVTGRQTQANFGVIDSTGAAAIFETAANQYWKFDANDSTQAPDGYILRTNFAVNGGGSGGIQRYYRTCALMADFYAGDSLNYHSILRYQMRDFSDIYSNPFSIPYPGQLSVAIPYGYIYCDVSICRSTTVSTAVIHGVKQGESPKLSTMWVILGQSAGAIAVPYWPVGSTPAAANGATTAPLCDCANLIRTELFDDPNYPIYINTYNLLNGTGGGLWTHNFPAEDSIFAATESILQAWRQDTLAIQELISFETQCADYALSKLQQAHHILVPVSANHSELQPTKYILNQNYPNPFNPSTVISWQLAVSSPVKLTVYNIAGQEVAILIDEKLPAGFHHTIFDASDLASGLYLYRIEADKYVEMRKMVLIK